MNLNEFTDHISGLEQEKKVGIIISNSEGFPIYSSESRSEIFSAMSRKLFEEILSMRLKYHNTVKDLIINRSDGYSILSTVGELANFVYIWVEFSSAYSMRKASLFTRNLKNFLKRNLLNTAELIAE
jgi:hypothetical protein